MNPEDDEFGRRSPTQHFSLPAKPRSSPLALTIGIMLILALLAGGGVAIYRLMPKPAAPPPLKTPLSTRLLSLFPRREWLLL